MSPVSLYEQPVFRQITGPALRPGGLLATKRLAACGRMPAGGTVLDIGCGCGETVQYLRSDHRLSASGIDRSVPLLQEGLQRHHDLPVLCAEAEALPFASRSFDAVFCECVLSIVENVESALLECGRVLKDAGLLLVSDLYARGPQAGLEALDWSGDCCLRGTACRHQIEQRINAAGFSILLWEDHSRLLKELAARIVWQHGSLLSFWQDNLG